MHFESCDQPGKPTTGGLFKTRITTCADDKLNQSPNEKSQEEASYKLPPKDLHARRNYENPLDKAPKLWKW